MLLDWEIFSNVKYENYGDSLVTKADNLRSNHSRSCNEKVKESARTA